MSNELLQAAWRAGLAEGLAVAKRSYLLSGLPTAAQRGRVSARSLARCYGRGVAEAFWLAERRGASEETLWQICALYAARVAWAQLYLLANPEQVGMG